MPSAVPPEEPTPSAAEIRRRLSAYLAGPGLDEAALAFALDWLDSHPEVAAAEQVGVEPEAVLRQADLVLRIHAETRQLVPMLPSGMVRFRALAEALARDVCRLLGVDPGDQSRRG